MISLGVLSPRSGGICSQALRISEDCESFLELISMRLLVTACLLNPNLEFMLDFIIDHGMPVLSNGILNACNSSEGIKQLL